MLCFFFKQKTAYEMRISDWSSDVCSSDLLRRWVQVCPLHGAHEDAALGIVGHPAQSRRVPENRVSGLTCGEFGGRVHDPILGRTFEIGRESGRERVGQYG